MPRSLVLAPLAALALFAASASASAEMRAVEVGDLTIERAMSRPSLPQRPIAIYLTISNAGAANDALLSAASPLFEAIELHESRMQDGVMRMAQVETIPVPAGDMVMLKPGGLHLMAFGAPDPLEKGDVYPVDLVFRTAGKATVMVHVGAVAADGHHHSGHDHSGHGGHQSSGASN